MNAPLTVRSLCPASPALYTRRRHHPTGDGKPKVVDEKETAVYKRALDVGYQLKLKASRAVLGAVTKRFPVLPFTLRALTGAARVLLARVGRGERQDWGGGRKGAGAKRGAAGPALADRAARKRLPDARTPQQNANDPTPFFPKTTAAEGPASDAAKQLRLGLVECLGHGLLHAYPVLHEKPGELVAQVKGTVLLMPNGSDRVTSAPEQPVETDKKVEDEELRKLLATGLKVSKKSKKKAASAGGGGDAEAA